jgi:hypothetical protein
MAITSLDLELQAILRYGFDYIRKNLDPSIEEIFENLKSDHLQNLYGDRQIQQIKDLIANNEIPINIGFPLNPTKIPAIYIILASSVEDVGNAFLGDHAGMVEEPINPRIIVDTFVPVQFVDNSDTGIVTLPTKIDLTNVFKGNILIDAKNEAYLITRFPTANSIEIILEGDAPDLKRAKIASATRVKAVKIGETFFKERADLVIMAHSDSNTTMWIYHILIWVLMRFKPEIEKRCIDLHTMSASDIRKKDEMMPNNVYARWMSFSARTRISWKETYPEQPVGVFSPSLSAGETVDGIETTVPISEDSLDDTC